MKIILFTFLFVTSTVVFAQKQQRQISLEITNSHSAFPFGKFASLFTSPYHLGFLVGYEFNWKTKPKHDWFQTFKGGYFFHRFVQHGIPLYTATGYRYKLSNNVHVSAALGVGYMHSIPAMEQYKLNDNGEYENGKGIGRGQAILNFTTGLNYILSTKKATTVFINYQQQIQAPFIKSYVPLLPYNIISFGFKMPFTQ
jgi:hypothetical protein